MAARTAAFARPPRPALDVLRARPVTSLASGPLGHRRRKSLRRQMAVRACSSGYALWQNRHSRRTDRVMPSWSARSYPGAIPHAFSCEYHATGN